MTIKKIGFACKISEMHPTKGIISIPEYNFQTTTVAWLNRQRRDVSENRLWSLMDHNLEAAKKAIEYIGNLEESLRCFRLGSDILPVYTESSWSYFWKLPDVIAEAERRFAAIGRVAKEKDIRLSFHPGQFCVLASDNEDIVGRSIEEFEYHADMVRWMGYGQQFQDFKINVHISGRQGPDGIRKAYNKLSPEARNCITIENEEITHGFDTCITLCDIVPIVLDIHHNWVREGEYILPSDHRIKRVVDSWRGRRPVIHYSVSREDLLNGHSADACPDFHTLIKQGHSKSKLRAHSDFMWNRAVNLWALEHREWADIMVECKSKNLGSFALYEYSKQIGTF